MPKLRSLLAGRSSSFRSTVYEERLGGRETVGRDGRTPFEGRTDTVPIEVSFGAKDDGSYLV